MKKPATLVVSSRQNDITLAELHQWFKQTGTHIQSLSELVRLSTEALHSLLDQNGMLSQVQRMSVDSGRQYLHENAMATKGMRTQNFQTYLKELQIEQASSLFIRPVPTSNEPTCVDPNLFNTVLAELEQGQSQADETEGDFRDELLKHLTKEGENS